MKEPEGVSGESHEGQRKVPLRKNSELLNFIMTGREIALPLDIMLGTSQDGEKTTAPEYVQGPVLMKYECSSKKHVDKQRKYYNLTIHGEE